MNVAAELTRDKALSQVANALGLRPDANLAEIVERAEAVVVDRIQFENDLIAAYGDARSPGVIISELRDEVGAAESFLEASRQLGFERERHIAFLTSDAAHARLQVVRERKEREQQIAAALETIRRSSSWRLTLPLRAARHPVRYLRAMSQR